VTCADEAVALAIASSPDIHEAEENIAKALAAVRAGKLEYVPTVAVVGGYTNQTAADYIQPNIGFFGVVGSYTFVDWGKRRNTIREREQLVAMATLKVQQTQDTVRQSALKAFREFQETQQALQLAGELVAVRTEAEKAAAAPAASSSSPRMQAKRAPATFASRNCALGLRGRAAARLAAALLRLEGPFGEEVDPLDLLDEESTTATQAARLSQLESAQRLLHGAAHVLLVVGLRGGEEAVDLLETVAMGERALQPALIGNQDAHRHRRWHTDAVEHLLGVGELRDHVRPHEAGHLEAAQARGAEQLDQADFVRGRDHLGLVLKPVARADLANPHLTRQNAHASTYR